jgi:hypothetical protein
MNPWVVIGVAWIVGLILYIIAASGFNNDEYVKAYGMEEFTKYGYKEMKEETA